MRLRLFPFVILVLILCSTVSGQATSCLDAFRAFRMVEPMVGPSARNQSYLPTMAWYGECIVVGASDGLWLYDPKRIDDGVQLARIEDRAINNVAVNPETLVIAFGIAREPVVHLINPDSSVSSVRASGDAVTDITFSSDGSMIAVASSDIVGDEGFYYYPRVQVWDADWRLVASLQSDDVSFVTKTFVNVAGYSVVIHKNRQGYFGDEVEYWDLETVSRRWDYSDLLRSLEVWTARDPLLVLSVSSRNQILALGGLDGYHDWDDYLGTAVHIWDTNSQQRIHEIVIHTRGLGNDYLADLSLNSDGLVLATAQNEGIIRLWNTLDGSIIDETNLSIGEIRQLEFSADDQMLSILDKEVIVVLDVEPLEEIVSFVLNSATSDDK